MWQRPAMEREARFAVLGCRFGLVVTLGLGYCTPGPVSARMGDRVNSRGAEPGTQVYST